MNNPSEILRDLSNTLIHLADEMDARDRMIEYRINMIESEIHKNKDALRAVANTILENI